MRTAKVFFPAMALAVILTGCWDRNEINDYAFWIGTALDLTENGLIQDSAQMAIPAQFANKRGKGGSQEKGNIVLTTTGTTLLNALQEMQDKLPRKIFIGHRRAVFVGEKFARKGLEEVMDQFSRNPDTRLRTDMFVVKGREGKDALEINSPFNQFSAIAAVDQDRFCRLGDVAMRDFLLDAGREGIRPSMPMIEIAPKNKQEEGKIFVINSVAIFNKNMRMVGELRQQESLEMYWIKNILKDQYITETSDEGRFSLYESNLKRKIQTDISQEKIKVAVALSGTGRLLENSSKLDLSASANLQELERKLNEITKKRVEKMIKKVQEKYGQDVFGFGEEIHREHPYRWKTMRDQWDQVFPTVEVSVSVDLHIVRIGKTGKPVPI